jgi:hypothetical protein
MGRISHGTDLQHFWGQPARRGASIWADTDQEEGRDGARPDHDVAEIPQVEATLRVT